MKDNNTKNINKKIPPVFTKEPVIVIFVPVFMVSTLLGLTEEKDIARSSENQSLIYFLT